MILTLLFLFRTPLHCAASSNNLKIVQYLVENGACLFATTYVDKETAAQKCDEDDEGFEDCSRYLCGTKFVPEKDVFNISF